MKKLLANIHQIYMKYERPVSSISLVGGFIFSIFTLTRVDMFFENVIVVAHVVVAVGAILFLNVYEERRGEKSRGALHFWIVCAIQFAFGGLVSTFLVFYARSATLESSWPFLLLLALAFIANETMKKRYERIHFQIAYLFLSLLCFSIYAVPVLLRRIDIWTFLISGLTSLFLIVIFIIALARIAPKQVSGNKKHFAYIVGGIFVLFNILYFSNSIPPLPIALKEAYVSVGGLSAPENNWWSFITSKTTIEPDGQTVYAFTAIFLPVKTNINIIHEWQYLDMNKKWKTLNTVSLPLIGGREAGYRTYSLKQNTFPGLWRVNVKTTTGLMIGRLKFDIK